MIDSWIAWAFAGMGLSVAGIGALMFFFPPIAKAIEVALAFVGQLAPLLGLVVEGVTVAAKIVGVALVDIMDTWQTQVFFAVLCTGVFLYVNPPAVFAHALPGCKPAIEAHMKALRNDYTFVPKKKDGR